VRVGTSTGANATARFGVIIAEATGVWTEVAATSTGADAGAGSGVCQGVVVGGVGASLIPVADGGFLKT